MQHMHVHTQKWLSVLQQLRWHWCIEHAGCAVVASVALWTLFHGTQQYFAKQVRVQSSSRRGTRAEQQDTCDTLKIENRK